MYLKNIIGKNHINQILLELRQLTIQIKIKIMPLIKNTKVGNPNKILSNLILCISLIICSMVRSEDNLVGLLCPGWRDLRG